MDGWGKRAWQAQAPGPWAWLAKKMWLGGHSLWAPGLWVSDGSSAGHGRIPDCRFSERPSVPT